MINSDYMTAAVLHGKEDVRIESIPVPSVGPGEVRVRINTALTCGTDVKVFRRGYHAKMIVPPAVFGHEFSGVIESVGEGVEDWVPGMRVVAANSAPCGKCFYCIRNNPELCEDLLFINGAYADYITIPQRITKINMLRLSDNVSYEHAALTEPLACVVHGVEETGVQPGETVTVIGEGQIGLMFVRLCKLAGARVISIGRIPGRLELARQLGADIVVNADETDDVVSDVKKLTEGGRGPDRVIECVGIPELWEQAIRIARKAATVNLFGGCPNDTSIRVDTDRIHYDELTIKGTFHHTPKTVRKALALISDRRMPAGILIGKSAPLSDLPLVLHDLICGTAVTKVAIHPEIG